MHSTRRWLTPWLALTSIVLVGCPSTGTRNVAIPQPADQKSHPAFTYRDDRGLPVPGNPEGYSRLLASQFFLLFDNDEVNAPSAFVAFIHLTDPDDSPYAADPVVFLEGRVVLEDSICFVSAMENVGKGNLRFLRLRPGDHHLHVRVPEPEPALGFGLMYDEPLPRPPLETVLSLRAGDACTVITGVRGGASEHGDPSRTATRTVMTPREVLVPDAPQDAFPTAAQVLAQVEEQATAGDPAALFDLGMRHLLAIGVPQNSGRAEELIDRAALAGYVPALRTMGELITMARYPVDPGESRRRAERGNPYTERAMEGGCRRSAESLLGYYRMRRVEDGETDEIRSKIEFYEAALAKMPERPLLGVSDSDLIREVGGVFLAEGFGRQWIEEQDFERALEIADSWLAGSPTSWRMLTLRADALQGMRRYEEALAAYELACEHVTDEPEAAWAAWHGRGMALIRLERFEGAVGAFRTALECKRDPVSHFALATALSSGGDLEVAIVELGHAIELAPGYGAAYGTRALYHAQSGDAAAAIADYREARAISPANARILRAGLEQLGVQVPD